MAIDLNGTDLSAAVDAEPTVSVSAVPTIHGQAPLQEEQAERRQREHFGDQDGRTTILEPTNEERQQEVHENENETEIDIEKVDRPPHRVDHLA